MRAHIYYFKYPRLQIELVHEEVETFMIETIHTPADVAYIYIGDGRWVKRVRSNKTIQHKGLLSEQVPKEIRAHHLLLGVT